MPGSALFLTGASGFVGRALLARLPMKVAPEVLCLSRSLAASPERKATFVHGSLEKPELYRAALARSGAVIHLAARTGKARAAEYRRTNVEATRVLIEECRKAGVRRFLYVSTIAAGYPEVDRYPYARSKREAEELVRASGLEWTIVRPTMVLGFRSPNLRSLAELAAKPVVPLFGGGRARIQPIWSDDLGDLLVDWYAGQGSAGEVLDLGGREETTFGEFLRRLRKVTTGREPRFASVPVGPAMAALSLLEGPLLPFLPLTAGQLYAFRYDGTARPNPLWEARRAGMKSIDEMLALFKTGPEPHPFAGH